jgi:thymidylate synthase
MATKAEIDGKKVPFDGAIEPQYYSKNLRVGGGRSDIAICTLWTKEDVLKELFDGSEYGLRGPLYSLRGAEFIVRNVLLNPAIRQIVIAGSDANDSPAGLLAMMENGLGTTNEILGLLDQSGKPKVFFDPRLPADAIDVFRSEVAVYDLRNERDWRKVKQFISGLPVREPFSNARVTYPETVATADVLPSEKMGIRIERETIADAWLDMLYHIRTFGEVKPTDKGRMIQELASLNIVLDENPEEILERVPAWLPVTKRDIEAYLPSILGDKPVPGVDLAYTYGMQLKKYGGKVNQIRQIEELIKQEWHTKRAVAITWELPKHLEDQVSSAPCLTDLMFLVQNDKLYMSAHFRSHDMYRAWLQNVYGLRIMQSEMAENIGIDVAKLQVISNSAHLWQDVIPDADRLLGDQYPRLQKQWREDPRGNFLISVEGGNIHVKHVDMNGNLTGKEFVGGDGKKLYQEVVGQNLISLPEHSAYLAWELSRANRDLVSGKDYTQDQA